MKDRRGNGERKGGNVIFPWSGEIMLMLGMYLKYSNRRGWAVRLKYPLLMMIICGELLRPGILKRVLWRYRWERDGLGWIKWGCSRDEVGLWMLEKISVAGWGGSSLAINLFGGGYFRDSDACSSWESIF